MKTDFLHILSYFALPCFVYCFLFRPIFHNVLFMILILSPFSLQTWKQFMNSFKSVFKQEKAIESIQALLFKVALNKINIYSFGISIFFDLSALTPLSITFSGVGFSLNVLPMKTQQTLNFCNKHSISLTPVFCSCFPQAAFLSLPSSFSPSLSNLWGSSLLDHQRSGNFSRS